MNTNAKLAGSGDTASDTLVQKSKSEGVISGGHLVAKALKAEGVDTIFTLCGGDVVTTFKEVADELVCYDIRPGEEFGEFGEQMIVDAREFSRCCDA